MFSGDWDTKAIPHCFRHTSQKKDSHPFSKVATSPNVGGLMKLFLPEEGIHNGETIREHPVL